MSKFLLQISKALVNSKIQFLFEKNFSSEFGPPGPPSPVLARSTPQATARVLDPSRPARAWRIYQKPPLIRVCAARRRRVLPLSPPRGPRLSASSSPRVGRPEACLPRASSQLIAPRPPASIIATPIKAPYSPP
jgi:hypothetical protein